MTSPAPSSELEVVAAPALIGVGVATVVDEAQRLGLTWQLRPATVATVTAGSSGVTILYDGDTVAVNAVNLLGTLLVVGARVMGIQVPPGGNFVAGHALTGYVPGRLVYDSIAVATAPQALDAVAAAVAGVTHTFVVANSARYMATGMFDFDETTTGATVCIGELFVDGVVHSSSSQALFQVIAATDRTTVAQQWEGTLTAGSHTLDSRVRRSVAAGTQVANTPHTTLRVQVYE
jgi:hypothetical protein